MAGYLHYGQLVSSHVQPEALNYEAFFNDTDVTHDAGTVGYGSPMFANYYQTAIATMCRSLTELAKSVGAPVSLDNFSATSVSASQPRYQTNATASRTMAIEGSALNDTVRITAKDGKAHALGFLLYLMGKAEKLPEGFVPVSDPAKIQAAPGFQYWKDVSRADFHDKASFQVKFGSQTLRVDFELPGKFTLWHGSAPDQLPRLRDAYYLESRGADATLKTTMLPRHHNFAA